MIYRLDDLCESRDFEHDQKFVKAEHWKEACDEVNDLIKTKKELEQNLAIAVSALELISLDNIYVGENGWRDEHFLNVKQAKEALNKTSQNNYKLTQQVKDYLYTSLHQSVITSAYIKLTNEKE